MEKYETYLSNFFTDNASDISGNMEELVKKLVNLIIDTSFEQVGKMYQEIKPVKYSGQGYLQSIDLDESVKDKIFSTGYAYALLDIMKLYYEKLNAEREIRSIKTKYRDPILSALVQHGTMFHKDLASAVGLSASGLSAVIKQMNAAETKTIVVEEVSKFKLYTITPAAYKYAVKKNFPDNTKKNTQRKAEPYFFLFSGTSVICKKREWEEKAKIRNKTKIISFAQPKAGQDKYNKKIRILEA